MSQQFRMRSDVLMMLLVGAMLFAVQHAEEFPAINIRYSAYNELEGTETQFMAGEQLSGQPKAFVQFMDQAALVNPKLRYNSTNHPVYGTFVDAINGVYGRLGETYWAFLMMRPNGTLCYIPLGVSSFVPSNGDHIIFQYVGYDFYSTSCFD